MAPPARATLLTACLLAAGCGDDGSAADGAASHGGQGAGASGGQGGAGASTGGGGAGGAGAGGGGGSGAAAVWHPPVGTSWQWQLADYPIDTSFDVTAYDVDLVEATDGDLATLRDAGRVVICYFSAGSWESYRPDAAEFPEGVKGDPLDPPFDDERWLDVRTETVRSLIAARLDLAASRGCDAVEPDNVDGYDNDNGLGLTASDQLDFNTWLAQAAHARGLSVGLKNDLGQLVELEPHYDWALNEECYTFGECDAYADNFIASGKAVLHAEYVAESELGAVCAVTSPLGLSTLIKNLDLDAYRVSCP